MPRWSAIQSGRLFRSARNCEHRARTSFGRGINPRIDRKCASCNCSRLRLRRTQIKNPVRGKCRLPLRLRSKRCATLDLSRRFALDDRRNSISSCALDARLGSEAAPIIVGARHDAGFSGAKMLVADATASRDSAKSKSSRCHAPAANPSSTAFTVWGYQHEEIANDHHY
jgi:hypothetical protein